MAMNLQINIPGTNVTGHDIAVKVISQISPLPGVITQLIRVLNDDKSSSKDVERIMSFDKAITANVLKMANSAFYGQSGKVNNIARAIAIIGYTTAINVTFGLQLKKALSSQSADKAFSDEYWAHSVVTAIFARRLAQVMNRGNGDDMFLAGLMHDIAWEGLVQASLGNEGIENNQSTHDMSPLGIERRVFGIDHQELSAEMLVVWGLPSKIAEAVRYHHTPEIADNINSEFTNILHLADYFALTSGYSFTGDMNFKLSPAISKKYMPNQESADRIAGCLAAETENLKELIELFIN
jgi:HD-like signal output (HDOD) protein